MNCTTAVKHNCTCSGWLQGRGVVGQHSPGTVASLLPPLFVLHGTGCVLTGGNTCVDDQRGRLEKSGHPGGFPV